MKNKEILEVIVFNSFMNDKISYDKYKEILEFVGEMTEKKALSMLKEQGTALTAKRKAVHSAVGAGVSLASGGTGYVGYRLLKGIFSKCARACGVLGLNTLKRQLCLAKCKVMVAQKEIQEVGKMMGQCTKTSDPQKCKLSLQKKLLSAQNKLKAAQAKYQKIAQYGITKGKEAPEVNPDKTKLI